MKTVKIVLDKERDLVFDFGAMMLFESSTGINTLQDNVIRRLNTTNMFNFLWACFRSQEPEITVEQVVKLVPMSKSAYVFDKCLESWKESQIEMLSEVKKKGKIK
jgi:hypothetical protein